MKTISLSIALLSLITFSLHLSSQEPSAKSTDPKSPVQKVQKSDTSSLRKADPAVREALEKFNNLIGSWRGTAQPVRGSNRDAWKETADWLWDFSEEQPALLFKVTGGKQTAQARLSFDPQEKSYILELAPPSGDPRTYSGKFENDKLVLEADPAKPPRDSRSSKAPAPKSDDVHRFTLSLPADNRAIVLLEKRRPDQTKFSRVAEIGYTRAGTSIAPRDGSGPECIVTGGAGTIKVSYQGKNYYVCCSGCKQAFDDDPAAVIKEASLRRKSQPTSTTPQK